MKDIFQHLLSLKRGVTQYGLAPHKPIMILSVIDGFEAGEINQDWIEITDDLLLHFHDNWKKLVRTQHVPNFSLPFFHLKNEKGRFWDLVTYPGKEIPTTKSRSIKSYKALKETVWAAKISKEFYSLLMDPVKRLEMKQAILKEYFSVSIEFVSKGSYSNDTKAQMLYDPEENYARKVKRQIDEQHTDAREEYVVLRSSVFRKAVLEIYDNQCAVTGLKVSDTSNRPLLDACHIVPFAKSYNDSVRNGIALSPTFHRAFDKGLLSISNDYRVLLHPELSDLSTEHSLRQYEGREVILPEKEQFYPSRKYLQEHRSRWGW